MTEPAAGTPAWPAWPAERAGRVLLVMSFTDALGTGLFLAGSVLFFTRVLGLSGAQIGLGLSLSAVTGVLCTVPLARLADRLGSRRTLVALLLWRGFGFLAYLFVSGFPSFVAVACLLGAAEWAVGPVLQGLVAGVAQGGAGVRAMARMNVVRNAGFACGALMATVAISAKTAVAYRGLVAADAASFFLAALLLATLQLPSRPRAAASSAPAARVPDPAYLLLAAGNGILFLHTVVLTVGLPLWIATRTHAPAGLVGAVVFVNTALAMLLGVRLSRGVEGVRTSAARQHRSGWCLAAGCALVALTGGLGATGAGALLLVATVALTLAEVWQSIGGYGLSYSLAPQVQRTYYLAVYNLGEPVAVILGPALFGAVVLGSGAVGWLAAGAVFAAAGIGVRALASRLAPTPTPTSAALAGTGADRTDERGLRHA